MGGFDYRTLCELGERVDLSGKVVSLEFGPFEIKDVPYATFRELDATRELAADALRRCFISQRVMWEEGTETSAQLTADLRELARRLDEPCARLADRVAVPDRVCCCVLRRWRELTRTALERADRELGAKGGNGNREAGAALAAARLRDLLGEYRRHAYGAVAALAQLLPDADETGAAVRLRLQPARESLASAYGIRPEEIGDARWHIEAEALHAESFEPLTLGVP